MKTKRDIRGRFTSTAVKVRKFIVKLFIITIFVSVPLVGGYYTLYNYLVSNFAQASATVEFTAPREEVDNRPIKERLWDDLDAYDFTLEEKLNTYLLIGSCENRTWDPEAKYNNGGSVDRGLFMINDYYHSEVSNACAYNYECSLKEFVRIYREKSFREWTCGIKLGLR